MLTEQGGKILNTPAKKPSLLMIMHILQGMYIVLVDFQEQHNRCYKIR
jgi:DNA-binding IscR family transcriptional regulator